MSDERELTCSLLVKDDSVKCIYDSELYPFLKAHGFSLWRLKDYPACRWVYISLTDKTYMPGIPFIHVAQALGAHAITVDEFYQIFRIYEKYNGRKLLDISLGVPYPLVDSVKLVSQTMTIRISVFDQDEIEENGDRIFKYRFTAQDNVFPHHVDVAVEDTISAYGIKLLCDAFADGSLEADDLITYSWGRVEFAFCKDGNQLQMMLFVYLETAPDEDDADDALNHDYLYMESEASEVEKFKEFIHSLNCYEPRK